MEQEKMSSDEMAKILKENSEAIRNLEAKVNGRDELTLLMYHFTTKHLAAIIASAGYNVYKEEAGIFSHAPETSERMREDVGGFVVDSMHGLIHDGLREEALKLKEARNDK